MPEPTDLAAEVERLRAQLAKPCGECHPCRNWVGEEWRRLDRKPPNPDQWDQAQAEVERLRGLLGEALDGWWAEHQEPYGVPGDIAPGQIARLRGAGGLT